jgi:hypothetical protein
MRLSSAEVVCAIGSIAVTEYRDDMGVSIISGVFGMFTC